MNFRLVCAIALTSLGGVSACGDDGASGDGSTTTSETDGSTSTGSTSSSSTGSSSSTDGTSSSEGSESSEGGSVSTGSLSDGSSSESSGSGTTGGETTADTSSDTGTPACDCQANEYCDWPDDACGDGEAGTCTARPMACDDIYDPVCGCDGQTYPNDCDAASMGVDVDYAGECEVAACACEAGEWCPLPVGECDSDEGVCEDIPNDACPEIYAPVCGCDGQTYSSDCVAANAGMNIAYEGECER